jgi:hypothetical protein
MLSNALSLTIEGSVPHRLEEDILRTVSFTLKRLSIGVLWKAMVMYV